MKKSTKIIMTIGMIVIITTILLFLNGIYGNPISKIMAQNSAESYISDKYEGRDFEIEDVFYNFKDGYYHAEVQSPSSIDTHFTVSIYRNNIINDSYESDVESGWNTYQRINEEYMKMVKKAIASADSPIVSNISFGTFELIEDSETIEFPEADYGIKLEELTLDKKYDIKELAKTKGHIIIDAEDEEVSFTKASELLLIIKDYLDDVDIPFYAIDFGLEKPRTDEGTANEDDTSIYTANILYEQIEEDNLEERIEKAHRELMEYYEEEDAKLNNID